MTPLGYLLWTILIAVLATTGPALIPLHLFKDPAIAYLADAPDFTPISGWYGPGAWLAYAITTGSSLYHLIRALYAFQCEHVETTTDSNESPPKVTLECELCHRPRDEWDADLLVSLVYSAFSSVDLMKRCIPVVIHPEALKRADVPALQAAATATYVGYGVAQVGICHIVLRMILTPRPRYRILCAHYRRLVVICVLLVVTYVGVSVCEKASFMLNEYNKTHKDNEVTGDERSSALVNELPTNEHMTWRSTFALGIGAIIFSHDYSALEFVLSVVVPHRQTWKEQGKEVWQACIFFVVISWFLHSQSEPFSIFGNRWKNLRSLCYIFGIWTCFNTSLIALPMSLVLPIAMAAVFGWSALWLMITPGSGFFPYSGISLMELDQLGAFVTIVVVFGVRLTAHFVKYTTNRVQTARIAQGQTSSLEMSEIQPVTNVAETDDFLDITAPALSPISASPNAPPAPPSSAETTLAEIIDISLINNSDFNASAGPTSQVAVSTKEDNIMAVVPVESVSSGKSDESSLGPNTLSREGLSGTASTLGVDYPSRELAPSTEPAPSPME